MASLALAGGTKRRTRVSPLALVTILTCALTGAAVLHAVFFTRRLTWNGGCGDDGLHYCNMANGALGDKPWSRRILLSHLVRLLGVAPEHVPGAFAVLNLLALGFVVLASVVFAWKVTVGAGVSRRRARQVSFLAGALILLLPMGLRFTLYYPVLVDTFAAALGLWWFVLFNTESAVSRWASVPLAFLAVITKEVWLAAIVAALLVHVVLTPERLRIIVTGAVLGAAAWIVLHAPGRGPDPSLAMVWGQMRSTFTTSLGLRQLGWGLAFGWGLLPLLLLRYPGDWRWRASDRSVASALAMAGAFVAVSASGGADVHRYVFSVSPIVVGVVLSHAARHPDLWSDLALLIGGSVLIWRPFHAVNGSRRVYTEYFSPMFGPPSELKARIARDTLVLATPVLCWIALMLRRRTTPHGPSTRRVPADRYTSRPGAAPVPAPSIQVPGGP